MSEACDSKQKKREGEEKGEEKGIKSIDLAVLLPGPGRGEEGRKGNLRNYQKSKTKWMVGSGRDSNSVML